MGLDTQPPGVDNPGFVDSGDSLHRTSVESSKNQMSAFSSNKDLENGDGATTKIQSDEERAQWGNSLEFLMSCIAMSVGLGNIWRFPFTARENGGGAFLIPYLIILTLVGRPLYYMEMALGQFSNQGNVKMYEKLSPVLKVIGYGQLIGSICVATYYSSLMAITLFYLVNSFTSDLPWTECSADWVDYLLANNKTCISSKDTADNRNITNKVSSSELYFRREVLREYETIDDGIGSPGWELSLCLFVSWLTSYLVSIKGVQSSGKASYFLAIFPYIIMITLLIRAATLDGAGDGMYYFIETDWEKLADAKVWYAAVTQCFFSLNVGFGSIIMYSSYNNFDHPINRDALVVTTLDTFTSLLSGATIFGILGNLAFQLNVEPSEVVGAGGTSLAFISYPEAIAKFEAVPWLFAILFFFMLYVLGIGSLVALQSCVNTVIQDAFPEMKMWMISGITAVAGCLISLIYITPGGQYMLEIVDHFGGTFIVFVFVLLEVFSVAYLYGTENFCLDLEYMVKKNVSMYWRLTWHIITPVLLFVIFVYFLATLEPLRYGSEGRLYPDGVYAFGWLILVIGVVQALIWLAYYLVRNKDGTFKGMIKATFTTATWSPKGEARTEEWRKFKENAQSRRNRTGNPITDTLNFLIGRN